MLKTKKRLTNAVFLRTDSIIRRADIPIGEYSAEKIKALVESIARYGMISPLTVRPSGRNYELISGHKRLMAARMLSLDYVPCIIINAIGKRALEISFAENYIRCEQSIFEKSEHILQLMKYGESESEIARRFRIERSEVSALIRLLRLKSDERFIINENHISPEISKELARIGDHSERFMLLNMIVSERLGTKAAKKLITKAASNDSYFKIRDGAEQMIKGSIKDIGIIENSFEKIAQSIKESGIDADSSKEERDNEIIFTLRISSGKESA